MTEIRRLQKGDEDMAREVIARFWPHGQLNDEFLAKQTNYLLAAYVNNSLSGFAYAYELDRIDRAEPMMFLYSIDVLLEYRQQGVGKRLIQELKRICAERNVSKMFVLTDEENTAAMKLYQSTKGKRELPDNVLFVYENLDTNER